MNEQRQTPYDTGKVKIGMYYEHKRPPQNEGVFAEMLQTALIEPPQPLFGRIIHRFKIKHFTTL